MEVPARQIVFYDEIIKRQPSLIKPYICGECDTILPLGHMNSFCCGRSYCNKHDKCIHCGNPLEKTQLTEYDLEGHDCLVECSKCEQKYRKSDDEHDCILSLKKSVLATQKKLGIIQIAVETIDKRIAIKLIEADSITYFGGTIAAEGKILQHGFGTQFDKEKLKFYEGNFSNGKKEGHGRTYVVKGENIGHFYVGEFKDDQYHGEGEYRWPDGDSYKGSFKEGQQDGLGQFWFGDTGNRYLGFYKEGVKNGYGIHVKKEGDAYIGEYSDDSSDGLGIFKFAALHEVYLGQWKQGLFHGQGMYQHADQSLYMGSFISDKKHSNGVFYNPSTNKMSGVVMDMDRQISFKPQ